MTEELTAKIKELRRKGFSASGIARQTGISEREVCAALKEPHLLAQISRETGKSRFGVGVGAGK